MHENIQKKRGRWESFDEIDGLGHICNCLFEDRDGNLWVGTSTGLSRYNGRKFVTFTPKDGFVVGNVWDILQDSSGNLWIGTDYGLSRYDGKKFIHLTQKEGLALNEVRSISLDREGNLWIGTRGGD